MFEYATNLQTLNDISSISAYFLGASFFFFIINFVWSIYLTPHEAPPNPWNSLGLEWQTPTPVPWFNFEHIPVVLNDPYHYGEPDAAPVADLGMATVRGRPGGCGRPRGARDRGGWRRRSTTPDAVRGEAMDQNPVDNQQFESFVQLKETPEEIAFELRAQEGALWTGGRLLIGIWAFAFAALAFAYFYLRSANNENLWRPRGVTAPTATGAAIFAITVACALLVQFGDRRFRDDETLDWQVAGWTAVLGGLARHRPPDLADDGPALLPGIERLRLLLHRLGRHEHRRSCSAGPTGSRPSWPGRYGCAGPSPRTEAPPTSTLPGGAPVPGQPQRLHVLLGLHRRRRHALLGTVLRHLSLEG